MAQSKTIQLLRSSSLYVSKEEAKSAILARTAKDGEVILARYQVGTVGGSGDDANNLVAKSLLGIYHAAPDLEKENATIKAGWTIIEDSSTVDAILAGLDFSSGNMAFEGSTATDDSVIVVGVAQDNGQLDAVVAELGSVKVDSVTATSATSKIAADQTLTENLGRLQGQIDAMDLTAVGGTSGDVVTAVSQNDGKVSASKSSLTDVVMTGYTKDTNATGAIAITDTLEQAFSKVENAIAKNEVASVDASVTITQPTTGSSAGKTDLAVNVDGTTIIKSTGGALKADLTLTELTSNELSALSDSNVKEAYKMIYSTDSSRNAIGNVIKIYKDSSLLSVDLLHADLTANPQLKPTYSNNTWTDIASASQTEANLALCFAYQLADGTTSVEAVPVGNFLRESEFSNGLQVTNGVVTVKVGDGLEFGSEATGNKSVKVKIDSTSEKDSQSTPVDFLSVSSNGVKVSGIKDEIDRKIAALDVTDTAAAGQYVSAVNETDGKVAMTRANVSEAVLNNYSKGSSADPVAATDTVNAAISKLENQVDAAMDAATAAHTAVEHATGNTHVTVSASQPDQTTGKVTYTVNETNIADADDLTAEIAARKAVDGQSGDTYTANSGANYIASATSLNNADVLLDTALKTADDAMLTQINGSNAIDVTTKASKQQTVSLKLDTTTASHNITSDMLQITSNGLMMKDTWDCGVF